MLLCYYGLYRRSNKISVLYISICIPIWSHHIYVSPLHLQHFSIMVTNELLGSAQYTRFVLEKTICLPVSKVFLSGDLCSPSGCNNSFENNNKTQFKLTKQKRSEKENKLKSTSTISNKIISNSDALQNLLQEFFNR